MRPHFPVYRFGPFELHPRSREFYKNGIKLKLRPQPFQILQALVEHPGDVVTRQELRQLLWPGNTFVDFEHGLNSAIKDLREALNDTADAHRYIETLPRAGYRIVVPVEVTAPPENTSLNHALVTESVALAGERRQIFEQGQTNHERPQAHQAEKDRLKTPPFRGRRQLATAIITVAAIAGFAAEYAKWSHTDTANQSLHVRPMLAVLPFENLTGDPSQEYFSDGLTEEMIGHLGQIDPNRLGVIARTSSMHYKHTQTPLPQIARELGVQYVLEGSVRRDAKRMRISAQLIQVKDQSHLWARQYDREGDAVLSVQDQIARDATDEIQMALGGLHEPTILRPAGASGPTSYEAYDLYLKGLYSWNKRTNEGFRQAADYFQKAIDMDPNYARAYAGLANTLGLQSTWRWGPQNELMPKARAAALKALHLDETVAEAHAALALVAEEYDYDWRTAQTEFQRAIQLDPSYATAHQWYAEYLSLLGRFDEALSESERALQLDPLSLIIATDHGSIFYRARRYDRAIEQFRVVLEMESGFEHACAQMSGTFAKAHRFDEALDEINRCVRPRSESWANAIEATVYGEWGRTAEAEKALARFEDLSRRSPNDEERVAIYSAMGRKDQAITLLQRLYKERSGILLYLKVDPIFDPLRGDPRFQDLLRELRLNQS